MADPSATFEAYSFDDSEKLFYSRLFRAIEKDNLAQGGAVAELLRRSHLSDDVLGRIWDISDRSFKGYLTRIEFFVLMRAAGLAQNTKETITIDRLATLTGLDLTQLVNLGADYPVPLQSEVEHARQTNHSDLGDMLQCRINPQFHVTIATPTKHEGGLTDHMTYPITVFCTMGLLSSTTCVVNRRYSDFEWLRHRLIEQALGHVVPPLPTKKYLGRFEKEFLEARRNGLETFLNRVTSDPQLLNARPLITFLQADDKAFTKAKATGPSLVQQVILALQEMSAALHISFKSNAKDSGSSHALPTDARLEDFRNRINMIKARLKDVNKLHQKYLTAVSSRLEQQLAFVLVVVPPCAALSLGEVVQMQDTTLQEFAVKKSQHIREFSNILETLIGQVQAVQEAIQQRKDALTRFQKLQHKVEAKEMRVAALKNNPAKAEEANELDREVQSLMKESDAARHRYDIISRALEKEILDFEKLRETQIVKALQSITAAESSWAQFQVKMWQNLLKRMADANDSGLACTVDVPKMLLKPAEPVWRPITDTNKLAPSHLFVVGQAAETTIPPLGSLPSIQHSESPAVHTSFGHTAPPLAARTTNTTNNNNNTNNNDNTTTTDSASSMFVSPASTLPSYAHAAIMSPDFQKFQKVGDRHDDDDDYFSHVTKPTGPAITTPSHWHEPDKDLEDYVVYDKHTSASTSTTTTTPAHWG